MQHLTLEALARLVDDAPAADEGAHLRDCLACRRELGELRAQTAALSTLADPEPPAGAWAAIEAALRDEGLLVDVPRVRRGWSRERTVLRAAAAVVLFLLGGASGVAIWARVHPGREMVPRPVALAPVAARPVVSAEEAGPSSTPVAIRPQERAVAPDDRSGARLASIRTARPAPTAEQEEAARELARAEEVYLAALQRYAAIADPRSGADPATRMTALDRMISTTRAALDRTPDDPMINGYHLAALRERDALTRQMATADADWF